MPARPAIDRFLDGSETPEVDLGPWLLRLMIRGDLLDLGGPWVADAVALSQPYRCDPSRCSPGLRAPRHRSCCADLEVVPTEAERAAIRAALPEVDPGSDPRWAHGTPEVFTEDGALARPGRRCIFARSGPGGLACALHRLEDARGRARGTVKPTACRLFPLAVVDLGDGRRLLTAVHARTARALGSRPAAAFPCLGTPGAPPVAESERDTLVDLLGRRRWTRLTTRLRERRPSSPPDRP